MKKYIITNAHFAEVARDLTSPGYMHAAMAQGIDGVMQVSDGYHTMDELYDHRITLYIALCRLVSFMIRPIPETHGFDSVIIPVWRSRKHSDGELCFGTGTQFVLGIGKEAGKMITYHLPIERWEETEFAETLETAPEWDGHTSQDVLERLKKL